MLESESLVYPPFFRPDLQSAGATSGGTSAATMSEESVANTVEDKEAVRSVAMRGQSTASSTSSWATNLGNDKTHGPSPRWSLQSTSLKLASKRGIIGRLKSKEWTQPPMRQRCNWSVVHLSRANSRETCARGNLLAAGEAKVALPFQHLSRLSQLSR